MSILTHTWGDSRAADQIWASVAGLPPSLADERILMFYQAYIDESEKDGVFVLAGNIATAEQWAGFSSEWEALLKPFGTLGKDGYHFKMSEMAKNAERLNNIKPFLKVIHKHVACSVVVVLRLRDIESAMEHFYVQGKKVDVRPLANPWVIGFQCLLDTLANHREEMDPPIPQDEPIDFFFDERAEKNLIFRQWDEFIKHRGSPRMLYGHQPVFGSDQRFLPLQAADCVAWWSSRLHSGGSDSELADPEIVRFINEAVKIPTFTITYNEDSLFQRFKGFVERRFGIGSVIDRNLAVNFRKTSE